MDVEVPTAVIVATAKLPTAATAIVAALEAAAAAAAAALEKTVDAERKLVVAILPSFRLHCIQDNVCFACCCRPSLPPWVVPRHSKLLRVSTARSKPNSWQHRHSYWSERRIRHSS